MPSARLVCPAATMSVYGTNQTQGRKVLTRSARTPEEKTTGGAPAKSVTGTECAQLTPASTLTENTAGARTCIKGQFARAAKASDYVRVRGLPQV
jgi:hypothetical protein